MPDHTPPPDQAQRELALDTARSILVQAPAGSGKTDLLTRRFLALLATVDDPRQIVAITFTTAAAAEMRHRILSNLESAAAAGAPPVTADPFSMPVLAWRALERSRVLGWQLTDLPTQLRISTIDSFCHEIAIQQPLLSGFGADLQISESPTELYRRAARRTLEHIDGSDPALASSIKDLLLWRDNGWHEMEELLVEMLQNRDRWMHQFVLGEEPDWDALRDQLERPLANTVRSAVTTLDHLFDQCPDARDELLALSRFGCEQTGGRLYSDLAEMPAFPIAPYTNGNALADIRAAYLGAASMFLTTGSRFRTKVDKSIGFPAASPTENARLNALIASLRSVPGLESALASFREVPPPHYTDNEARILRACFTLLRHAAVELRVVFAEAGLVDFTEVSQIALRVLADEDGQPTDAAINLGHEIHHILVDEFQDTSRRQHALIGRLVAAWPDPHGRTLFVVGDPMQSIYFFRDADAELFPRVRNLGLDVPNNEPLLLDPVSLTANFRSEPSLVNEIGEAFKRICAIDDGSGIAFSPSQPARESETARSPRLQLHLDFVPQSPRNTPANQGRVVPDPKTEREAAQVRQSDEIIQLIQVHEKRARITALSGKKYRIAVLGRTRKALDPIAHALHEAGIPFRAVDLESLKDRPEVLDALALGRALLNPMDRVAWLGVLRAPWSGLSLADLHTLTSNDDSLLLARDILGLLPERLHLLSAEGRSAVERVLRAVAFATAFRSASPNATLGTWIEQVWLQLGGASCVNATGRANLNLLWSSLDALIHGAPDVLSSALDSALLDLKALPDPEAVSDNGVQLMTIHKAKGLEFEIVIVPELQARSGLPERKLLSWLERGIAQPDDGSGDATEFLVAPIQPKGEGRGSAQQWVERIRTARERQEMRRLFYVAATRAREELHLFARPEFRATANGPVLCDPIPSLLATAWAALQPQVVTRFKAWITAQQARGEELELELPLAASIPATGPRPTRLHRLPLDFEPPDLPITPTSAASGPIGTARADLFARHEGGILTRALGNAAHAFMEEFARLRNSLDSPAACAALAQVQPRIAAEVRATGISRTEADSIAAQALALALRAAGDLTGQWILSPHVDAASEASWTGIIDGKLRTVRVDRVFRAGAAPLSTCSDVWWIIDYKTAQAEWDSPLALRELHTLFAPQLEAYAAVLRRLHGVNARIITALYYPRMLQLDWWETEG